MASLARSVAALRSRAPRATFARLASTSTPSGSTPESSAPAPAEASSSTVSPSAATSSTAATESSPDASPVSVEPSPAPSASESPLADAPRANAESVPTASRPIRSSTLSVNGDTPWGPSNSSPRPSAGTIASYPKSHQVLPTHPAPPPPWHKGPLGIHLINYPRPLFPPLKKEERPQNILGGDRQERRMTVLSAISGLSTGELRGLRRCVVDMRYVVNMTKKGKIRSSLAYVVVGDPERGLVGLGRGRGQTSLKAVDAAYYEAVLAMDAVDRYEDRTLYGQGKELVTQFGSTKVSLRARPPGFGLQVPGSVHRILAACGIKDASAQIDGSKHKVNVMKAVLQILHGGANPPGFGDGTGGHGKRENKGAAMRSKAEIERTRGRYGVDIGLRV